MATMTMATTTTATSCATSVVVIVSLVAATAAATITTVALLRRHDKTLQLSHHRNGNRHGHRQRRRQQQQQQQQKQQEQEPNQSAPIINHRNTKNHSNRCIQTSVCNIKERSVAAASTAVRSTRLELTTTTAPATAAAFIGQTDNIGRTRSSSNSNSPRRLPSAHEQLIGCTPLIPLYVLSQELNLRNNIRNKAAMTMIYVKMEHLNPSGTGKDRAALAMIEAAEASGNLPPPIMTTVSTTVALPMTAATTTTTAISSSTASSSSLQPQQNGRCNSLQCASAQQTMTISATETSTAGLDECARPGATKQSIITKTIPTKATTSNNYHVLDPAQLDMWIAQAARHSRTGGIVVEGTSGSTGIALAAISMSRGHACLVVMPNDQSIEKQLILQTLGAIVVVVPVTAIAHPAHYVNVARKLADRVRNTSVCFGRQYNHVMKSHDDSTNSSSNTTATTTTKRLQAVFMDQFENLANVQHHYHHTGPELWRQCQELGLTERLTSFVMSAGTGGTIAGIGRYLKEQKQLQQQQQQQVQQPSFQVVLVDPIGSALYHSIQHGVCYAPQQAERRQRRHRDHDSLVEGIGLDRWTANLLTAVRRNINDNNDKSDNSNEKSNDNSNVGNVIDSAIRVTDQEAIDMAHWLLRYEGLWVGSSSAMNIVGAVRVAARQQQQCHPISSPIGGSVVITVICDSGQRHMNRFWSREYCISEWDLIWPTDCDDVERIPECLQQK